MRRRDCPPISGGTRALGRLSPRRDGSEGDWPGLRPSRWCLILLQLHLFWGSPGGGGLGGEGAPQTESLIFGEGASLSRSQSLAGGALVSPLPAPGGWAASHPAAPQGQAGPSSLSDQGHDSPSLSIPACWGLWSPRWVEGDPHQGLRGRSRALRSPPGAHADLRGLDC